MLGTWIEPVMAQLMMTGFGMAFPVVISIWRRERGEGEACPPRRRHSGFLIVLNVGTSLKESNRRVNTKSISKKLVDFSVRGVL
jgi:hypothetical protein